MTAPRTMRLTVTFEFNSADEERDSEIIRAISAELIALCESIQETEWSIAIAGDDIIAMSAE